MKFLKCDHENSALDCKEAYTIICRLEKELENARILKIQVKKENVDHEKETVVNQQNKHIQDL